MVLFLLEYFQIQEGHFFFLDPFDFLSQAKKKDFSKDEKNQSLLVLMEMKPEVIDHFLAENKHVTELNVHFPNGKPTTNRQVDFLSALKTRYKNLDLSIRVSSDFDRSEGREISMGL